MFSNWSFLRIHAQERDCCLRWGLGCWLPEEPLLLPTMAAPTSFPAAVREGPLPHTPPEFLVCRLDDGHSGCHEVVLACSFASLAFILK